MPRKGKNQSLKAVLELRDLVLNGKLEAGKRLYEVSICEQIGMSRTPVREALNNLEHEGLLERLPSGGFMVRTFSFDDVIDGIELRGVLEGTAARLAAERGGDATMLRQMHDIVAGLDQIVSTGAETLDFIAYADLNRDFHLCLSALSGSDTTRREIDRTTRLPMASPSAFLNVESGGLVFRESLIGAQEQHRNILEAIELREGARAESIAREHARLARKNLEYVMTHGRSLMKKVPGLSLVAG
ncbi:MAG: GntR family transcriptional regulator of vanillate catabolism [Paracoccaceae bacterium]|jgi:GntR family transcriptional regulator of vanillate catabolism